MYSVFVVPAEPLEQLPVERSKVHPELLPVEIRELFLDGAVEALGMSVLFRRLGTSVIVDEVERDECGGEVPLELRAVVGEDEGKGEWEYRTAERKKVRCGLGGVRGRGEREPEAGVQVDERDDVSAGAVDILLERVEGDHVARVLRR